MKPLVSLGFLAIRNRRITTKTSRVEKSKVMPSMVENYITLIKQSLACYQALIEIKHLIMSH